MTRSRCPSGHAGTATWSRSGSGRFALLSSGLGAGAISEIERLLRVLPTGLVGRGITANVPGRGWAPARSNRRFRAARRRLEALLAQIIDGYRRAGADHGDLMSILVRARDDETGAAMSDRQLRDEVRPVVSSTLVPSELPVIVTRRSARPGPAAS